VFNGATKKRGFIVLDINKSVRHARYAKYLYEKQLLKRKSYQNKFTFGGQKKDRRKNQEEVNSYDTNIDREHSKIDKMFARE
jgi:hypothetical protein